MSAIHPFNPTPIVPGDLRSLKGFEHEGQLHQPRRLETRQPLVIAGLKKNIVYDLNFANKLKHDFLVTGISADIANDDGNVIQDGTRNNYRFSYVQAIIQSVDKDTQRVLRTINIYISSYPNYLNELLISPDSLYKIKVNQDVNDITLLGVPVHVAQPIVFYNPPSST